MAKAKKHNITTEDPVFAAIEKHKKATREFSEALLVLVPGTVDPDPKKVEKYGDREDRATAP